jgi:hypothetical protein
MIPAGSHILEMPEAYNGYVWSHWLEDRNTNRIRIVILEGDPIWTGVYVPASLPPVGGEWIPINKLQLLAPWISSALLMLAIAASSVYFKNVKKRLN